MPSVLFVCKANRYRSPIAAAAFAQLMKDTGVSDQWLVGSAGTWTTPGLPPIPEAIKEAKGLGLDIRGNQSQMVNESLLGRYDLILVMEDGQKEAIQIEFPRVSEKIHTLAEVTSDIPYDIPDPVEAETSSERHEIILELIDLIKNGYRKICELATRLHPR